MAIKSDFLLNFVVGIFLLSAVGIGFTTVFYEFADNYDISISDGGISDQESFAAVNELTTDISENVQELGIEDESSNSKIISVGWNSVKLMLRSPGIFNSYMNTLSNSIDLSIAGVDFIGLIMSIVTVTILMILILLIMVGRV